MSRRWIGPAGFAVVLVVVAGGVAWLTRSPADDIDTKPPKGAPASASCWDVAEAAVGSAFPWPGSAVDCAGPHTAEVFYVGQVERGLTAQAHRAKGDDAVVAENLMYAHARRSCVVFASAYLGGDWRGGRVRVIASWIKPHRSGHYGCALAETADPAGARLVRRTGTVRDAMKGDAAPLAIDCVAKESTALSYVPCEKPHDGEFVGTYMITPPDAPFDEAGVRDTATGGCAEVLSGYLRLPAGTTRPELRSAYVGPAAAGEWLGSDQTFACYAMANGDRKLRGSVKGLGPGPLPT